MLLVNKQEKDAWLYQLIIISDGGAHNGTQYEQMIQRMEGQWRSREVLLSFFKAFYLAAHYIVFFIQSDCNFWRNPLLLHSKDSITSPLTTLSSETLHNEAIKLFKVKVGVRRIPINFKKISLASRPSSSYSHRRCLIRPASIITSS